MARAYTKEDIIGAFLMRFIKANLDITSLEIMANNFYDKVGKEKFRTYGSVDAQAMKDYFNWI
jgi:flagellum-specific peptidoglycan hydrolase FlgJ